MKDLNIFKTEGGDCKHQKPSKRNLEFQSIHSGIHSIRLTYAPSDAFFAAITGPRDLLFADEQISGPG